MINTADDGVTLSRQAEASARRTTLAGTAMIVAIGLASAELALVAGLALVGAGHEAAVPGATSWLVALGFGAAFVLLLRETRGYRFALVRQPELVLPQLFGTGIVCVAAGMAIIGQLSQLPMPDIAPTLLVLGTFCLAAAGIRFALAMSIQLLEKRGGLRQAVAVIVLDSQVAAVGGDRLRQKLEAERHHRCALTFIPADSAQPGWCEATVDAARWAEDIVVLAALDATPPNAAPPDATLGAAAPPDSAPGAVSGSAVAQLLETLEIVPVPVGLAIGHAAAPAGFAMRRVHAAPLGPIDRLAKRTSDIVLASLALLFLAPLLLLLALLVKLDSPGPVLFRQTRRGYNNRTFAALKFRSLRHEMADPLANRLVTRDDPRVTRIGAFLRRSSMDELPQLLNVLKGDMSLVGPRPHPLNAKAGGRLYEDVVERFQRRYRVRPGITGWAQVNGLRGNTETEQDLLERVLLDLAYIRHWSLWLDLWILLKTPLATLKGENAC